MKHNMRIARIIKIQNVLPVQKLASLLQLYNYLSNIFHLKIGQEYVQQVFSYIFINDRSCGLRSDR